MIRYLLSFKNLPFFHLWMIFFYYSLQSVYGFFVYEFDVASEFFILIVVSCCAYIVVNIFVDNDLVSKIVNGASRISVDISLFAFVVFCVYVPMICYVAVTTDQIALIQAFQGVSVTELSASRENFLRTRDGWEAFLPYINALFVMALIPYVLASLFYLKNRFRFVYFFIFIFCLSLTLEKSLAVLAFLPLIVLLVNRGDFRRGLRVLVVFVSFLVVISFLARGGVQDENHVIEKDDTAATIPDDYKLFNCNEQICYLGNRVIWIPYATAIDWLMYRKYVLNDGFVYGASTGFGSYLLGVKKIELEKDVFAFQWGQNETGTGSSNVVYFIDAYLNFSWFGVILYSILVAIIVKCFHVSDNVPLKSVVYVSLFYLAVNSLPPMLSSGGLFVLLMICFFIKPGYGKCIAY